MTQSDGWKCNERGLSRAAKKSQQCFDVTVTNVFPDNSDSAGGPGS